MANWYIQRNGKQAGPFVSAQLKQLAAEGKIRPEDHIRRDDQDKWHNAGKVKGLFEPVASSDTVTKEPLPATAEWLRHVNGQETGPMSFLEVCEKFRSGEIGATDFIAQRSMKWVQAGAFLEPAVVESAVSVDEWFIIESDQKQGPYTFSHLQERFENKEISESSLIGRRGSKGIPAMDLIPVDSGSLYDRMRKLLLDNSSWDLRVFAAVIGFASALTLRIVYVAPLWIQILVFCVAALISYLKMQEWRKSKECSATEVGIAIRKKATWIAGFFVALAVIMWLIDDFDYYPFQYLYAWTCIILVLGLPAIIYKSSLLDSWYMNVLEVVIRLVASHLFCIGFIIIFMISSPIEGSTDEQMSVVIPLSFACSSILQGLIPFEWLPMVLVVLSTLCGQMLNNRSVGICPRCRGRGLCYTCRGAGCSQCHPLLPGKCVDCDGTGGRSVLWKDSGIPNNTGAR